MSNLSSPFQVFLERFSPALASRVSSSVTRRQLQFGETLFTYGDSGEFWFFVDAGSLEVYIPAQTGLSDGAAPADVTPLDAAPLDTAQCLVRRLTAGEMGGLTSLTLNRSRSATVRAAAATSVFTLPKAALLQLLDQEPALSRALLTHLSERLRLDGQTAPIFLSADEADSFRVAFFDTKPYERESFERVQAEADSAGITPRLHISWLTPRLDPHTAKLAAGHHAVCAFVNDDLGRDTLLGLKQLGIQGLALRCAGFNQVDVKAATEYGIGVCRVPAYSPYAVAEHAVGLLLALNRKLHRAHNRVREGNFSLAGLVGHDLHGRNAGLIGLGKIGLCVASILNGFGMRVLAFDPGLKSAPRESRVELVSLDTLLSDSDVISLHAPLTKETHHLINAERLQQVKRGVILINTSRGALIDSYALIEALKSGQISAAGLDVYEEESEYFFVDHSDSVISDDLLARLLGLNNVLVTSHQGFLTYEALANIAKTTLENLTAFAKGVPNSELPNRVTP